MKSNNSPQGKRFMAYSIGIVYLWFGALKFLPGVSPAEGLASETIGVLTQGLLPSSYAMVLLAALETGLGVLFILYRLQRIVIPLALAHILLTFSPMLFFPEQMFKDNPLYLTLLGQYVAKNLIIAGVLMYLWEGHRIKTRFPWRLFLSQRDLS